MRREFRSQVVAVGIGEVVNVVEHLTRGRKPQVTGGLDICFFLRAFIIGSTPVIEERVGIDRQESADVNDAGDLGTQPVAAAATTTPE